jgi:hypothetical protein
MLIAHQLAKQTFTLEQKLKLGLGKSVLLKGLYCYQSNFANTFTSVMN